MLFVKNLAFKTTEKAFAAHFKAFKPAKVTIKTKQAKDGKTLSMGFGFVEFASVGEAKKALAKLQVRDGVLT